MVTLAPSDRPRWSSRIGFLIATIGFAVGLGNLWRFPYLAGENGGGAFVVLYVLAVGLIGLPLVIAELAIGRDGGPDVPSAWANVAKSVQASPRWRIVGYIGIFASVAVASFYCVIGGWTLAFAWDGLSHLAGKGDALDFAALLANPIDLVLWQTTFLSVNLVIVSFGLHGGLERAVKIMMPLLFVMMLGLLIIASTSGGLAEALSFLFAFDLSALTARVAVEAVGQAFFSVGIGLAVLVTYGGYLEGKAELGRMGTLIVIADTLVALLAGLMIFPFVFAVGLEPTEGPTLLFVTMQSAFGQMAGGAWLSALFFSLVAMAALTSTVALFEMLAALGEARSIPRRKSLLGAGLLIWTMGLGTVFSFNFAADFRPLGAIPLFAEASFFGAIDILTSNIALPLGGLLVSIFAGWIVPRESWAERLGWRLGGPALQAWVALLRYLIPIFLGIVLAAGILPR